MVSVDVALWCLVDFVRYCSGSLAYHCYVVSLPPSQGEQKNLLLLPFKQMIKLQKA